MSAKQKKIDKRKRVKLIVAYVVFITFIIWGVSLKIVPHFGIEVTVGRAIRVLGFMLCIVALATYSGLKKILTNNGKNVFDVNSAEDTEKTLNDK